MMLEPDGCMTVPFFTSVTVTGVTVVFVVMVAVPFMPGFQLVHGQLLAVDGEAEVVGTVSSLVPSGSLTTSVVAVHREYFEASWFPSRSTSTAAPATRRPSDTRPPRPEPLDSLHVS